VISLGQERKNERKAHKETTGKGIIREKNTKKGEKYS